MDKQRILIIGARGFLGMYAVRAAREAGAFEIIHGDRKTVEQPGSIEINIADALSVERAFRMVQPNLVLLLAAMSDIDRCEQLPEQAFAVNAKGAENVANACARMNARLLFTSSAAVFDGRKHGYREEDPISPLSVYGETKAWAESAVMTLVPSAVVIRFALVLGFAHMSGTNAMLNRLVEKWKAGETIAFPEREERNLIDATSLSKLMITVLAERDVSGIYHAGSSDSISRYELGRRLAARAGVPLDLVRAQDKPIPGRAQRGEDHFLLTDKIRSVCNIAVQTSSQVIERCFHDATASN